MGYSEVLGVAADATREEINAVYRRLAMAHHPDRGDVEPGRFEEITKARDALLNRLDSVGIFDDIFTDIARELRK